MENYSFGQKKLWLCKTESVTVRNVVKKSSEWPEVAFHMHMSHSKILTSGHTVPTPVEMLRKPSV